MARKAKIERHKRRVLHEVWPRLVAGPVGASASYINWLLRVYKTGFTEGERKYLEGVEEELHQSHAKLMKIYFRLKF